MIDAKWQVLPLQVQEPSVSYTHSIHTLLRDSAWTLSLGVQEHRDPCMLRCHLELHTLHMRLVVAASQHMLP